MTLQQKFWIYVLLTVYFIAGNQTWAALNLLARPGPYIVFFFSFLRAQPVKLLLLNQPLQGYIRIAKSFFYLFMFSHKIMATSKNYFIILSRNLLKQNANVTFPYFLDNSLGACDVTATSVDSFHSGNLSLLFYMHFCILVPNVGIEYTI